MRELRWGRGFQGLLLFPGVENLDVHDDIRCTEERLVL